MELELCLREIVKHAGCPAVIYQLGDVRFYDQTASWTAQYTAFYISYTAFI